MKGTIDYSYQRTIRYRWESFKHWFDNWGEYVVAGIGAGIMIAWLIVGIVMFIRL